MTDVLDQLVIAVQDDQPSLNRLLTAISVNGEISYLGAYELLSDAVGENRNATVRDALNLSGVKPPDVALDVTTLEHAAGAADRARDRVMTLLDLPAVDRLGRVRLLDAATAGGLPPRRTSTGTRDDHVRVEPMTYETIMNQPLHSQRLARARLLTGNAYDGPDGAARFQEADRSYAEGGRDLVAGFERDHAVQTAERAAGLATAQLSAAWQHGATPAERAQLVREAASESVRLLAQMEAPADRAQPAREWTSDRARVTHNEVQARRASSGHGYLYELSQIDARDA